MKQPHGHRSEAVAVQTVSVMIPLEPEVTVRNTNVSVLVAQCPDEVSLQANDPLDDLLLGILGGQDGDDVASLDLVVPDTPPVQQDNVTLRPPLWVQEGLHRRSLHSRHVGESIEDGNRDGDSDEEAADKRPQATPSRLRLLSHHCPVCYCQSLTHFHLNDVYPQTISVFHL